MIAFKCRSFWWPLVIGKIKPTTYGHINWVSMPFVTKILTHRRLSRSLSLFSSYCKTPLISTYVFSGLATEQVLIFGAVLTFGGYDKAEWKIQQGRSLFNPVLTAHNTLLCMFQQLCTYFQDRGTYIQGVCTFGALQPTVNFSKNWRGTYFRRGTYLRGFTVVLWFSKPQCL